MLLFNRFLFQLFREGQGQSAIFKFGMDILFLQVLADVEASAYIAAVAFLADIFNGFLLGFSVSPAGPPAATAAMWTSSPGTSKRR